MIEVFVFIVVNVIDPVQYMAIFHLARV